jgi:hypothetical protein
MEEEDGRWEQQKSGGDDADERRRYFDGTANLRSMNKYLTINLGRDFG